MEGRIYTEEVLRGKKYGELFKIGKALGVKSSKKLKTDKLIEAILECQDSNTISKDAGAVIAALADDQVEDLQKSGCVEPLQQKEIEPVEELLSDIQLPELFPVEEDELLKTVGESSENVSWRKNEENDDVNEKKVGKRRRSGTFEIEKKTEGLTEDEAISMPKRKRTSTYEIHNETDKLKSANEVSPVIRSQQNEENSKQLSLLVQKVSDKRRTRTVAVHSPTMSSPSAMSSDNQRALHSTKEPLAHSNCKSASKQSLLHNKELPRVTPATGSLSEMASKSKPKVPKAQSITQVKSLGKTATPSSARKSQMGLKLSVNTPKSNMKLTQGSKIVKPVFTVGRNDASSTKKEGSKRDGSGIPRFLSYARKIKVPNFAKIHERAFNRMEALDDYVDKKRKRTDTFSSETKKPKVAPEEVFQPTITSTKNLNLNFISTRSPASKTPGFSKSKAVQLEGPKSTKSLRSMARAQKLGEKSPKVPETPQSTIKKDPISSSKSCNTIKKTPKAAKTSTNITCRSYQPTEESPKQKPLKESAKKVATFIRKSPRNHAGMASAKKVSPLGHRSAMPRLLKENVKPVNLSLVNPAPSKLIASQNPLTSGSMPKNLEHNPKTASNIPSRYAPYKGAVRPLTNKNTLKRMAQRKPNIKSRQEIREGQKEILKGVRFNRRFELQMANRGINL